MRITSIKLTGHSSNALFGEIEYFSIFGKGKAEVLLRGQADGVNRPRYFSRRMEFVSTGDFISNEAAPLELIRQFEQQNK